MVQKMAYMLAVSYGARGLKKEKEYDRHIHFIYRKLTRWKHVSKGKAIQRAE